MTSLPWSGLAPGPAIFILLMAVTSCREAPIWPPEPAEPHWGETACEACRMVISEMRFGVQWHRGPGEVVFFDDINCFFEKAEGHVIEPEAVFVRAFDEERWVRADAAFIVEGSGRSTPMGSDRVAFADRVRAEVEAGRQDGSAMVEMTALLRVRPGVDRGEESSEEDGKDET